MSVQMQEQSQRTEAAPSTNGAPPVEDGVARPAGLPGPEAATLVAEAPAPAARRSTPIAKACCTCPRTTPN